MGWLSVCSHLQSLPPALMTNLSSQEKRMFVTWAEWPKYRLCFACENISRKHKEMRRSSEMICFRIRSASGIHRKRRSHTNFSVHGKSKSLMRPKSSPVTRLRPAWETQAQLTSAFSALRGQTPRTSSPRMLETEVPQLRSSLVP